jgi:hypothetical protein
MATSSLTFSLPATVERQIERFDHCLRDGIHLAVVHLDHGDLPLDAVANDFIAHCDLPPRRPVYMPGKNRNRRREVALDRFANEPVTAPIER